MVGIVESLAVEVLFGTLFIDCFKCRILPTKCKVVSWHSGEVAIAKTHKVEIISFVSIEADLPPSASNNGESHNTPNSGKPH